MNPKPERGVSQQRTEAVVLRGVDFSETSRIVTFLSPVRGRLVCMAKGVRRPKSQLAGMLDTFNRVELVYYWKDGRSVQQLADVSLLDAFDTMKADLEKATFCSFPLELAAKVAHENEPSEGLYVTLVHGMENLSAWTGPARIHCGWQVFRLLCTAGYEPSLDTCGECDSSLSGSLGFSYDSGVTCGRCRHDRALSPQEYATLRAYAADDMECPNASTLVDIVGLLRGFASRHIESDFRSVRVIEQMFG